jgi:PAS domain S-box-containing protein
MRKHEILYSDEMYNAPHALFVLDTADRIIKCNKRFLEISGYNKNEIVTFGLEDLCRENDLKSMKEAIDQVKKSENTTLENRITGKTGKRIHLSLIGWRITNSNGTILGTAWLGLDIPRDDHLITKKDRFYQQLYDELLNGFVLCEMLLNRSGMLEDVRFLDANSAFERLVGREKSQLLGNRVNKVLPWMKEYLIQTYKKVEKTGEPYHSLHSFQEIDKHCEINAFIPEKNRIILIFTDITAYKKTEEEKKHLQMQLIQSQKLEGIGRLAGGIAHDFNNLLTAILGYTDLAFIQTENREQLKENLSQIRYATQRAAKLVQQLLIFSRKQPMELKPHKLSEVIENLLKMLKRIIGEDIHVSLELDHDLWISRIDRTQIEQVIMNLAVNARDAMSKGGTLRIQTENVHIGKEYVKSHSYSRPGKFVCLTMADTGAGMDEETLQKIFEPFFTTKKSGEGTGLGLSMVYGIIKEHEGWITVSSEPKKGSVFKIYLPACTEKNCS